MDRAHASMAHENLGQDGERKQAESVAVAVREDEEMRRSCWPSVGQRYELAGGQVAGRATLSGSYD